MLTILTAFTLLFSTGESGCIGTGVEFKCGGQEPNDEWQSACAQGEDCDQRPACQIAKVSCPGETYKTAVTRWRSLISVDASNLDSEADIFSSITLGGLDGAAFRCCDNNCRPPFEVPTTGGSPTASPTHVEYVGGVVHGAHCGEKRLANDSNCWKCRDCTDTIGGLIDGNVAITLGAGQSPRYAVYALPENFCPNFYRSGAETSEVEGAYVIRTKAIQNLLTYGNTYRSVSPGSATCYGTKKECYGVRHCNSVKAWSGDSVSSWGDLMSCSTDECKQRGPQDWAIGRRQVMPHFADMNAVCKCRCWGTTDPIICGLYVSALGHNLRSGNSVCEWSWGNDASFDDPSSTSSLWPLWIFLGLAMGGGSGYAVAKYTSSPPAQHRPDHYFSPAEDQPIKPEAAPVSQNRARNQVQLQQEQRQEESHHSETRLVNEQRNHAPAIGVGS